MGLAEGESIRLGPDGEPYLVSVAARHDLQFKVAMVIFLTTLFGLGAGMLSLTSQAKARRAEQQAPQEDTPTRGARGARGCGRPRDPSPAVAEQRLR
ncbi:unnamed protein product [Prorocentrum cordatum]|uniref:RING-type E3 ubiquitin transferase n=1 Tax=Prorocentrum cordatum TaxID=2364126 RepID=A0ABN9PH94_9DINO|nr:unnamed protein product [Polarella glacialis]